MSSLRSLIKRSARLGSLAVCDAERRNVSLHLCMGLFSAQAVKWGRSRWVRPWREKREKYNEQKKFGEKKIYLYIYFLEECQCAWNYAE